MQYILLKYFFKKTQVADNLHHKNIMFFSEFEIYDTNNQSLLGVISDG